MVPEAPTATRPRPLAKHPGKISFVGSVNSGSLYQPEAAVYSQNMNMDRHVVGGDSGFKQTVAGQDKPPYV